MKEKGELFLDMTYTQIIHQRKNHCYNNPVENGSLPNLRKSDVNCSQQNMKQNVSKIENENAILNYKIHKIF